MQTTRYAARPPDPGGARSGAPRGVEAWSRSLTLHFPTDPDAIAAVLPPPLAPAAAPTVKLGVSRVDLGGRMPAILAGTVAVAASHGDVGGWYPLFMPMSTEQAVVGGREIYGEPKKLAQMSLDVDEASVHATVARLGVTVIEITGSLGEETTPDESAPSVDFYLKFLRAPEGGGLDDDAWLVHCTRRGETRSARKVDAELVLRDSRFDPVADLPVLGRPEAVLAERRSTQEGRLVERVPADAVLPFVHQRYDDLMAAAGKGA